MTDSALHISVLNPHAVLTDGQLLAIFAHSGSQEAFAQLVTRHAPLVLGVCRRVLAHSHNAEDAAQAVFLTLAQKAPTLQTHPSVAGWLQRVAYFVALRAREAAAIRRHHEQEAAAMRPQDLAPPPAWDDLNPVLDEELAALPDKYRLALVLHHLEGRSVEEAATLLNAKVGTVASWVSRGRDLLRARLARRGLALPAASLGAVITLHSAQTVSASFIASTAQAATLVAAGKAATAGLVSMQTAALVKGTLKMLFLAKLKIAASLFLAAAIPLAVGLATYEVMTLPADAQVRIPAAAATATAPTVKIDSIAWPAKITPVDYTSLQTAALAQKLDVSYRRATPAEVIADLESRTNLRVAYPDPLGPEWYFTLEAKALPVKDILERLAADGHFDLAFRPTTAVLTQKADDSTLAALEKQLASPDRWQRCQAVWGLGSLADPRIYPFLIKALSDKDAGVVDWTLKALERHARMGFLITAEQQDTLVTFLTTWLKNYQTQDAQNKMGRPAPGNFGAGGTGGRPGSTAPDTNNRLAILASTGQPQAVTALLDTIQSAPVSQARLEAVNALADNQLAAAALAQALVRVEAEIVKDRADFKPGDAQAMYALVAATRLRQDLIFALITLRVPEFVQTAQELTTKTELSPGDIWLLTHLPPEVRRLLNFGAVVERELKTLRTIYDIKAPVVEPALGGPLGGPFGGPLGGPLGGPFVSPPGGPTTGYSIAAIAATAARVLAPISDPAITAEFTKLVKDDKAFAALAEVTYFDNTFMIPVTDPDLVAALLTRVSRSGKMGQLALRSLGHCHDPAVADALIKMLKDPDPERAADAGLALAATRDPRALPPLVALLQEKRDWPDFETTDLADIKAGKAVRPRVNPRKALVAALLDLRDPQVFTALVAFAFDAKADKEIPETARRYLQSAVAGTADMDRLVELTRKAPAASQRDLFRSAGASAGFPWWMMPANSPSFRCTTDARWIKLLTDRVDDDDAFMMRRDQPIPRGNTMIDALAAFQTPHAEKALLDLCKHEDEHVAYFAGLALEKYRDPQLDIRFKP